MPSNKGRSKLQKKQRAQQNNESPDITKQPHSIVVCRGKTGKNLNNLMLDFRRIMNPYTATNLKAKKTNVLKDFLTIAGPLNVKHLVAFSKTKETVSMRLIATPKGPTMQFAIEQFVLRKLVFFLIILIF
jgi:ribosome biogenesis protein SSF1/2